MPLRNYAIALAAGLSCGLGILTGNLAAQDHLGQYAQSDIVKGAQVYAAACSTCHGPNGNNIGLRTSRKAGSGWRRQTRT